MTGIITKAIKTYFVTCKTSEGNQETFVARPKEYKMSDKDLLECLSKQTESELVEVLRRFTDVSAYWMSTEDFLKSAQKGKIYRYGDKQLILPTKEKAGNSIEDE